jgi:hypothetical protein
MTVPAFTFVLSDLKSGRGIAQALIVPACRYASVAWLSADCLDRRFSSLADWKLLDRVVKDGLPLTPFERDHVVPRVLLPEDRQSWIVVQYAAQIPIDIAPSGIFGQLDAALWRMVARAGEPSSPFTQRPDQWAVAR